MSDAARANAPTFDPTFWNLSAPSWDAEFRAWAAPLLKLSAEQAGLAVIVIGQLIECAWRLRRINTTMADAANLTHRDWCRALAEAQRAFSRAQTDYQRWVRNTERAREQSGGVRGARAARPAPHVCADPAPATSTQTVPPQAEPSDPHGSTHLNNFVANGTPGPVLKDIAEQAIRMALGGPGDPGWRPNRAARRAMKRRRG